MDLLTRALPLALLLFLALPARADLLSPGPLARAHAGLEGVANCTRCHVRGGQVSLERCLDCHKEIGERLAQKKGFHGQLTDRTCNTCHHEHQGRDFALIEWPGGQKKFDHKKAGWPLEGKHAQADCSACHVAKLVKEPGVRALIARSPSRATFLGLATKCADCHFDEHRGQLSQACESCHSQSAWKPAPGFSHAKTDYPLQGKHAKVECLKCHATTLDAEAHKDAPLPPKSEVFARMRPVAHQSCTDCHKDPHEGRLGSDCRGCHTVDGWLELKAASAERAFHEKTRYPLRGAHVDVACKSCHGPFRGVKAVFKGLKFDTCAACHVDAHLAQLGSPPQACDGCHSLQGFAPVRYDPARHKSYPLQGGHAVAACSGCHKTDLKLERRAEPIRAWLAKRGRKDVVVLTQFHPPAPGGRCDSCHKDPHRGQFAARVKASGCADCHVVASFAQVRFDHAKSRFPLEGAHARAACAACHEPDAAGVVRYQPLATACSACHADVHAAQLGSDCAKCHGVAEWKTTKFVHRAPFTAFELTGKHAALECAACHREVKAAGAAVRRYRGVPTECAGCHVDIHKGAFREVVP